MNRVCVYNIKQKLDMNDIFKNKLVLILLFHSFMTPATTAACSRDISNKSSLTGLQITMGLVGTTVILAAATGLWLARSGKKESNSQILKKEFTKMRGRADKEDRIIESTTKFIDQEKLERHNNNILQLAGKRMMIYWPHTTNTSFWRISPWILLKNSWVKT